MAAEVGGRLEAVAPRRSLFGPDYLRLGILFAVAIAVHAWLVYHTVVPARDSLGYARIANNLSFPAMGANPDEPRQRIDVIRTAEQPPGYPIAVWGTEKILRRTTDLSLADRSLLATQIANAVAAVLLVLPLYLIGRLLFSRNVGFAATLLFQVLPVPARTTSDGLSEGVFLLVIAVAILLGVRAIRRPAVGGFLLCGMATGASYLVRPEGLLVAIGVGMVIGWAGLSRRWPRDLALGRLTALLVGVALVATPYMLLIGKISNKPTEQYILDPGNKQPAPLWMGQPGTRAPASGGSIGPLFAKWWDPARDEGKCRELWALGAVGEEVFKALHYVIGILAVIGLFAHRRELRDLGTGMCVPVILGALSLGLMTYLAARIGYVSERHTLLFVMLSCIFAAASLEPFSRFVEMLPVVGRIVVWPKAAPFGYLIALTLSTLPFTFQAMHAQREGHKHAGRWLADHMDEKDWLKDPLAWGEWYAGRTLYKTPVYHTKPEYIWVIVEKGKHSPHSRLPLWEESNQLVKDRAPVFRWPENGSDSGTVVEVYQVKYDEVYPPTPPQLKPNIAPPPRAVEAHGVVP